MKTKLLFYLLVVLMGIQPITAQIVDGYTNKTSYNAGDSVIFYTRSNDTVSMQIRLFDINYKAVDTIKFPGNKQLNKNLVEPWKNGYGYASTVKWKIPANLKSGIYFIDAQYNRIAFVVKGSKLTSEIIVVCPFNSDMAYSRDTSYHKNGVNSIGMYGEYDTAKKIVYAPVVSFHRPIQHLDNSDGFLKWIYTNPYSYSVISDKDLEDYTNIENAKIIVLIGHSDYWTRNARLNFDKFVNAGKHALVLSGVTMWWQARYQETNGVPQLVCYRGQHAGYPINDTISNPLFETTTFDKASLQYPIASSVGAQWPLGGYGKDIIGDSNKVIPYIGFKGSKIIIPTSPILNGTNFRKGDTLLRNALPVENILFDGIAVSKYDSTGMPVVDPIQIGFYRAEIIAYDIPASRPPYKCAPILVAQKTMTSGKIINTSSVTWCSESNYSNPKVQIISKNMLDLLLTNSNVFSKPDTALNVNKNPINYSAINIYPNPNSGSFNINIENRQNAGNYMLEIYNTLGVLIESKNITHKQENIPVNLTTNSGGLYFIKITPPKGASIVKKVIIK